MEGQSGQLVCTTWKSVHIVLHIVPRHTFLCISVSGEDTYVCHVRQNACGFQYSNQTMYNYMYTRRSDVGTKLLVYSILLYPFSEVLLKYMDTLKESLRLEGKRSSGDMSSSSNKDKEGPSVPSLTSSYS